MATQSNLSWQFLNNQIANALVDSYGDTNIFATDHLSKLKNLSGDVDINRFIARTEPIYLDFYAKYATWQQSTALWKGATSKMDTQLDGLLKVKLPRWEVLIQVSFMPDSEEYITLFPQGRTAFRETGKDGKIMLLNTFVQTLGLYVDLVDVETDATDYLQILTLQRDRQQQREQAVRDASSQLRTAQSALFEIMYRNLGGLMEKYGSESSDILNLFDVSMIRTTAKKTVVDEVETIVAVVEDEA